MGTTEQSDVSRKSRSFHSTRRSTQESLNKSIDVFDTSDESDRRMNYNGGHGSSTSRFNHSEPVVSSRGGSNLAYAGSSSRHRSSRHQTAHRTELNDSSRRQRRTSNASKGSNVRDGRRSHHSSRRISRDGFNSSEQMMRSRNSKPPMDTLPSGRQLKC